MTTSNSLPWNESTVPTCILKSGLYIPDDAKLLYLLVHVTPDGNNYIPIVGYEKYVNLMLGTIEV